MTAQPDQGKILFQRLSRSTAAVDASKLIKEMILTGRLRPGEKLPSERQLSEALGISRATVRESITALVAMNILETHQGSGTFVASLNTKDLLQPIQFVMSLARRALEDLFEVRLVLEPEIARLAAERATEAEVKAILDCIAQTRDGPHDRERILELDVRLHQLIGEASHNDLLVSVLGSISALAVESRTLTVEIPGVVKQTIRDHAEIAKAIADRRPEEAREAMYRHISRVAAAAAASAKQSASHE